MQQSSDAILSYAMQAPGDEVSTYLNSAQAACRMRLSQQTAALQGEKWKKWKEHNIDETLKAKHLRSAKLDCLHRHRGNRKIAQRYGIAAPESALLLEETEKNLYVPSAEARARCLLQRSVDWALCNLLLAAPCCRRALLNCYVAAQKFSSVTAAFAL
eukprot:5574688-Pleurochrysis_carterae.AAC.3